MSYSEEFLQESSLTAESILEDLEDLRTYYEAMEIEAQIIPAVEELPVPSLVGMVLPAEEGDSLLVITNSFLPLDKEDAEFTKYLQFYAELADSLEGIDELTYLRALCRLNQTLPLGCCVPVEARPELGQPAKVGVRSCQGYPIGARIDQGVFTEDAILFELSCDLVSTVLDGLREGRTLDEVFDALGR